MGLFRSDNESNQNEDNQRSVEDLVKKSEGRIKKETLTKTGGMVSQYLYDGPIVEKLNQDEQPEYIFEPNYAPRELSKSESNVGKGDKFGKMYFVVTDERLLYVMGRKSGDIVDEIKYDNIAEISVSDDPPKVVKRAKENSSSIKKQLNKNEKKCSYIEIYGVNGKNDTYRISGTKSVFEAGEYINNRITKNKCKSDSKQQINVEDNKNIETNSIQENISDIRSELRSVNTLLTNAEFTEASRLLEDINSRLSLIKEKASQKGSKDIVTEIERIEKNASNRLSKSKVLSQLREMDPYEFEELVAKIWRKKGWEAEATTGSTDRGVDVVATKEDAFEKRRHLIQVKRHGENSTVGSRDIQQYASLYQRDEQVDKVFIVTSNQFTSEANKVAKQRDVSTVNGDNLYEMLTET